LLALADFMRLSLMKAAHADLFGAMCRKSGSPVFFGPGTLWRGAPALFLLDPAMTQTSEGTAENYRGRPYWSV
jgi:hypothetical protein